MKPGALTRPWPALTRPKTYWNAFWTATEDDANGPVNGPISVTVIVWGVEGAAAAVVAVAAAVAGEPAAVVAVAVLLLLLLDELLHAATVARAATTSAVPTRARVLCLPCGIADIFLLVIGGRSSTHGLAAAARGDAAAWDGSGGALPRSPPTHSWRPATSQTVTGSPPLPDTYPPVREAVEGLRWRL